jgi:hypothetical protein
MCWLAVTIAPEVRTACIRPRALSPPCRRRYCRRRQLVLHHHRLTPRFGELLREQRDDVGCPPAANLARQTSRACRETPRPRRSSASASNTIAARRRVVVHFVFLLIVYSIALTRERERQPAMIARAAPVWRASSANAPRRELGRGASTLRPGARQGDHGPPLARVTSGCSGPARVRRARPHPSARTEKPEMPAGRRSATPRQAVHEGPVARVAARVSCAYHRGDHAGPRS